MASRVQRDTPKVFAVLLVLDELKRRAADSTDGTVRATRDELGEALGVDPRTITRATAHLARAGWIRIVKPATRYTANTYHVLR